MLQRSCFEDDVLKGFVACAVSRHIMLHPALLHHSPVLCKCPHTRVICVSLGICTRGNSVEFRLSAQTEESTEITLIILHHYHQLGLICPTCSCAVNLQ